MTITTEDATSSASTSSGEESVGRLAATHRPTEIDRPRTDGQELVEGAGLDGSPGTGPGDESMLRVRTFARFRRRCGAVAAQGNDAGMATAEYAIAMIAAVGFAGLLVTVLTSGTVRNLLTGLVTSALSVG